MDEGEGRTKRLEKELVGECGVDEEEERDEKFYKNKTRGKTYLTNIGCLHISATHGLSALVHHSLSVASILYNACSSLLPLSTLILCLQTKGLV